MSSVSDDFANKVKASIKQFGFDPDTVFGLLGKHAVLTGSFLLWLLKDQPVEWTPNDIDIFCSSADFDETSLFKSFDWRVISKNSSACYYGKIDKIIDVASTTTTKKLQFVFVENPLESVNMFDLSIVRALYDTTQVVAQASVLDQIKQNKATLHHTGQHNYVTSDRIEHLNSRLLKYKSRGFEVQLPAELRLFREDGECDWWSTMKFDNAFLQDIYLLDKDVLRLKSFQHQDEKVPLSSSSASDSSSSSDSSDSDDSDDSESEDSGSSCTGLFESESESETDSEDESETDSSSEASSETDSDDSSCSSDKSSTPRKDALAKRVQKAFGIDVRNYSMKALRLIYKKFSSMSQLFCDYLVQQHTHAQRKVKHLKKSVKVHELQHHQLQEKHKEVSDALVREQGASKKATDQAHAIASSLRLVIQTFDNNC